MLSQAAHAAAQTVPDGFMSHVQLNTTYLRANECPERAWMVSGCWQGRSAFRF